MRTALLIVSILGLATACGGSKPAPAAAPAEPAPAEPAPTPTEPTPAEPVAAPPATPNDEVLAASALAEQYEVGKQVFAAKKCATCHEESGAGNKKNPAVIGEGALPAAAPKAAKLRKGVTFTTAADVVAFVKAKMPIKAPGTLTDDEAFAVVAWFLDSNKVALAKKLDASNAASIKLR